MGINLFWFYERKLKTSNLINIVNTMFLDVNESKNSQKIIDKCPVKKYTYSSLKHILEIGFKTHKYGGFKK